MYGNEDGFINDITLRKRCLRRIVAEHRRWCPEELLAAMSAQITERILQTQEYREAKTVFAYIHLPGEVRTRELILRCLEDGKRVAVPKIMLRTGRQSDREGGKETKGMNQEETGREMCFYEIRGFEHLIPGAMKIPEPDPECCTCLDTEEDALVIMPGVAFDPARGRVGYGGGFYDRYLRRHPCHPTMAAAYEFQIFDEVPCEEHDIHPQVLVTPGRLIRA